MESALQERFKRWPQPPSVVLFHSLVFQVPFAKDRLQRKLQGLAGNLTPSGLPGFLWHVSGNSCAQPLPAKGKAEASLRGSNLPGYGPPSLSNTRTNCQWQRGGRLEGLPNAGNNSSSGPVLIKSHLGKREKTRHKTTMS